MDSMDGEKKRNGIRLKKEMVVGVRTNQQTNLAYSIDLSSGGMKIGSPVLYLSVGELVELLLEKSGSKTSFPGRVTREDGLHYIDRIHRSGNTFFVRVEDTEFSRFVADNFFVY